jgi:hypothetical protein
VTGLMNIFISMFTIGFGLVSSVKLALYGNKPKFLSYKQKHRHMEAAL